MQATLQPVLIGGEDLSTDISVFLNQVENQYDVYLGVALLERVGGDAEDLSQKLLIGRLYNAGASLRHLARAFHRCPRAIKRWGKALKSGNLDRMAQVFAGRGSERKLTPEIVRYASQLYGERDRFGKNYRQMIIRKIKEIFEVEISATTASEIFSLAKEPIPPGGDCAPRVIGEQVKADSCTKTAATVHWSPAPLPIQADNYAADREALVHHAGQAVFAAEMKVIDDPFHRQIIAQVLQGAVNIEQSKTTCASSLANFTGPMLTGCREQRSLLDQYADWNATIDAYRLNAMLLADGPNRGDVFYFDPHTKEYTGLLKILKGWCGRRHGIAPIMNLDCFHTRSGRPCFIGHYSPYYDMRERFFMSLAQFDLLFDEDKRKGRTFVIDRGIYGLETIQAFDNDFLITWEKGYKHDGWRQDAPTINFTRTVDKNRRGDGDKLYQFSCQEQRWYRDKSVRRIIVRVSRKGEEPIDVSVLTTNPHMAIEDVVWLIFRRWLQENDFKYLDRHFGINQLTSRDSSSFAVTYDQFEDRPVDSPEYKELKEQLRCLDRDLGKTLVTQRKLGKKKLQLETAQAMRKGHQAALQQELEQELEDLKADREPARKKQDVVKRLAACRTELAATGNKVDSNAKQLAKVEMQIADIEQRIEPLETLLGEAIRKKSRMELLINANYNLLDTRQKALFDALRVTAANIFRNVQERFRAIYNNYRDDHVLVRTLTRCSGKIRTCAEEVNIELWLPGRFQNYQIRAFAQLLAELQEQINGEITQGKSIRFGLTAGPVAI